MKLSKLIRKQAATIADQEARLEVARVEWRSTREVLIQLRSMHDGYEVQALHGRHGAKELRCKECTVTRHPCDTRRLVDRLLEARKN